MLGIPKRQFGLFTVNMGTFINTERLFQTFEDAFDYISSKANGNEIFEIASTSSSVTYTFICYKTKYLIKFATATIHAHLFTYDQDKPLVTSNYMWKYEENNNKGQLQ